jgi:hypothetical protein
MKRGSIRSLQATVHIHETVDVEIKIDDLDDDELVACVDEAVRRCLIGTTKPGKDRKQLLDELLHDLMSGRWVGALERFEIAMFGNEGRLLDTYRALRAEDFQAAMVHLDYAIHPVGLDKMVPEQKGKR